MRKSDLKSGMLVQYRNGYIRMVVNQAIIGTSESLNFTVFNEDLTNKSVNKSSLFDIMKVSKVMPPHLSAPFFWTEEVLNDYLLWERETFTRTFVKGDLIRNNCDASILYVTESTCINGVFKAIAVETITGQSVGQRVASSEKYYTKIK